MPDGLTALERAVLDELLAGNDRNLTILREQLARIRNVQREWTEIGFFLNFDLHPDAPRLNSKARKVWSDVGAEIPRLAGGMGFLLFIEDGWLQTLEGYTYSEPLPTDLSVFTVFFHSGTTRDLTELLIPD